MQVSDTDRRAEPGAERSEQVTARRHEIPHDTAHNAGLTDLIEVEKGGCKGDQLDSRDRDDTILLNEGPWRDADRDQGRRPHVGNSSTERWQRANSQH